MQRNLIRGSQGVVPGNRAASPEIANLKETEAGLGDSVLAAAILRLQRAQRIKARGKAAIHAPQPGQAASCGEVGRPATVELSALRNGEDERGGDRVGVDRPTTGREQVFGKGASVNPTLRKVREGWGTRQVEPTIYLRARNIKASATISTNPLIHIQPLFQPCIPMLYPCTKPPQETAREKETQSNVALLSFAIHQSA